MGPVVGPIFTRTWVTVPLPAGTRRLFVYVGPTAYLHHVHDWACVGTSWRAPGTNGDGMGQTEQSNATFGGSVRSAPNVVTCAGTSAASATRSPAIGTSSRIQRLPREARVRQAPTTRQARL